MGFSSKGAYGFGSKKGGGGGGGGGCGTEAKAFSYIVENAGDNNLNSFTDPSLVGTTLLLPMSINGNVFADTDWSFDPATGTITYTPALDEPGYLISFSYTTPCGSGGCSTEAKSLSYDVGNGGDNNLASYTNPALVGATLLLPVSINGNVFMDTDWSFDSATGTITYGEPFEETGAHISISYTTKCGGGGGCSCDPVLFSHGDWDYVDQTGNSVYYPSPAFPLDVPGNSLEYQVTTSVLQKTGDYVTINARIVNSNPLGSFGFRFNSGSIIWVLDKVDVGQYDVSLKIKRVDVNGTDVYAYCTVTGPDGAYSVDINSVLMGENPNLPLTVLPYVFPESDTPAASTIYVDDYDITKFVKP